MAILTASSKSQIVIPAALRRRDGIGAGSKIEIHEESDGLRLRVINPINRADLAAIAGMAKAKPRDIARRLEGFDPASLLRPIHKP